MSNPQSRRIAQIIRIKKDSIPAYKQCHLEVWPSVLTQIKACNISDYSIFLDEQSLTLFASFKYHGTDLNADMEVMRANEEVRRWWRMTDSMQESCNEGAEGSVPGVNGVGWWRDVEEVFRCE